jgi:hypothetical protein
MEPQQQISKNDNAKKPGNEQSRDRPLVGRMADGEAIQCYELVFRQPFPDLGLDASGGSGRVRIRKDGRRSILYYPKLHLYRIEETYADKPTRVVFAPREWASFEPLADHHSA